MQVPLLRFGSIDAEDKNRERHRHRRWPCAVYASTTSPIEHSGMIGSGP